MRYSQSHNWKEQFEELKEFLREMYGEFGPDDGIHEQELEHKNISPPLKALYCFAGNRLQGEQSIISYNTIPLPSKLECRNNEIIFYLHEGHFYVWAAVGSEENPCVIKIDEHESRVWEEERLCGFLYQICIYEACLSLRYTIQYFVTYDKIHHVLVPWTKFPFKTRQADDFFPNMFFYSHGALGFLWINRGVQNSKVCTFFCGARASQNLSFMRPFIQTMGLKNDEITSVNASIRAEKGSWEFFKHGEPCREIDFW